MNKQLLPTTGRYLDILLTQLFYVVDSAFHFEVIGMSVSLDLEGGNNPVNFIEQPKFRYVSLPKLYQCTVP